MAFVPAQNRFCANSCSYLYVTCCFCTVHGQLFCCNFNVIASSDTTCQVLTSSRTWSTPTPTLYTLYTKFAHRQFPVLRCKTKLAQSTSQYYFVLQSLHKALPSTTLYYNACTKHFPVLLCTTKLARSSSQYYVLQSLHKVFPPIS